MHKATRDQFRSDAAVILAECDPCGMLAHSELGVAYNYIDEDFVHERLVGAYHESIEALAAAVTPQTTVGELQQTLAAILATCYPERSVSSDLSAISQLLFDRLKDRACPD